eukprot:501839-Pyramimonas_sp.AAC.1
MGRRPKPKWQLERAANVELGPDLVARRGRNVLHTWGGGGGRREGGGGGGGGASRIKSPGCPELS